MLHPQGGYRISHFSYAWLPKRTVWKEEAGPFRWRSLANTASAGCSWWHRWCQEAPLIECDGSGSSGFCFAGGGAELVCRGDWGAVWGRAFSKLLDFKLPTFPSAPFKIKTPPAPPSITPRTQCKAAVSPQGEKRGKGEKLFKEATTGNPRNLAKDTNLMIQELNEPQIRGTQWNPSQDTS